jgi:hypothetical protein
LIRAADWKGWARLCIKESDLLNAYNVQALDSDESEVREIWRRWCRFGRWETTEWDIKERQAKIDAAKWLPTENWRCNE